MSVIYQPLSFDLVVLYLKHVKFYHLFMLVIFLILQLPLAVSDADFEDRIIQHIAAAAAMRRARHLGQREGHRTRSSAHGHPPVLLFSTQPSAHPSSPDSAAEEGNEPAAIPVGSPSTPLTSDGDEPSPSQRIPHFQAQSSSLAPGSTVSATNRQGVYPNDR